MKSKKQIFVIENLDFPLEEWSILEYKHVSECVGKDSLWFTNIKESDNSKLSSYGKVIINSIKTINPANACILDPEAPILLTPEEAKTFDYLIFGGILGDNPPRKRTEIELTRFLENAKPRNLGKSQMSTDSAVFVAKQIAEGKPLKGIKFQDGMDIKINNILTTNLPYHYPIVNGKPYISEELIELIKKKDAS